MHLKNAFETVDAASALKAIPYLEEKEEKMLRIIAENGEITSGKLYEEFGKTTKLKERTMRQLLESLVNLNIVKTETVEMGNKGKTKKITTKAQSKAVLEKLGK